MNLLAIVHVAIVALFSGVRAYTIGVWFLITHPIQFVLFIDEWRKYKDGISDAEQVQASGFANLNRSQRRSLSRGFR